MNGEQGKPQEHEDKTETARQQGRKENDAQAQQHEDPEETKKQEGRKEH